MLIAIIDHNGSLITMGSLKKKMQPTTQTLTHTHRPHLQTLKP